MNKHSDNMFMNVCIYEEDYKEVAEKISNELSLNRLDEWRVNNNLEAKEETIGILLNIESIVLDRNMTDDCVPEILTLQSLILEIADIDYIMSVKKKIKYQNEHPTYVNDDNKPHL